MLCAYERNRKLPSSWGASVFKSTGCFRIGEWCSLVKDGLRLGVGQIMLKALVQVRYFSVNITSSSHKCWSELESSEFKTLFSCVTMASMGFSIVLIIPS